MWCASSPSDGERLPKAPPRSNAPSRNSPNPSQSRRDRRALPRSATDHHHNHRHQKHPQSQNKEYGPSKSTTVTTGAKLLLSLAILSACLVSTSCASFARVRTHDNDDQRLFGRLSPRPLSSPSVQSDARSGDYYQYLPIASAVESQSPPALKQRLLYNGQDGEDSAVEFSPADNGQGARYTTFSYSNPNLEALAELLRETQQSDPLLPANVGADYDFGSVQDREQAQQINHLFSEDLDSSRAPLYFQSNRQSSLPDKAAEVHKSQPQDDPATKQESATPAKPSLNEARLTTLLEDEPLLVVDQASSPPPQPPAAAAATSPPSPTQETDSNGDKTATKADKSDHTVNEAPGGKAVTAPAFGQPMTQPKAAPSEPTGATVGLTNVFQRLYKSLANSLPSLESWFQATDRGSANHEDGAAVVARPAESAPVDDEQTKKSRADKRRPPSELEPGDTDDKPSNKSRDRKSGAGKTSGAAAALDKALIMDEDEEREATSAARAGADLENEMGPAAPLGADLADSSLELGSSTAADDHDNDLLEPELTFKSIRVKAPIDEVEIRHRIPVERAHNLRHSNLMLGPQVASDEQVSGAGKYVYAPGNHYHLSPAASQAVRVPAEAGHYTLGTPWANGAHLFAANHPQTSPNETSRNDVYFLVMVGSFLAMASAVVLAAGLFAYRVQQNRKLHAESDYPTYGVVGPNNMNGKCGASSFVTGYFGSGGGHGGAGGRGALAGATLAANLTQACHHGNTLNAIGKLEAGAKRLPNLYGSAKMHSNDSGLGSAAGVAAKLPGSAKRAMSIDHSGVAKSSVAGAAAGASAGYLGAGDSAANQNAARMYHYQHQKQQMIISDRASNGRHTSASDLDTDTDDENEEGSYTVYECPGLASAHEIEIKNPLFHDDRSP